MDFLAHLANALASLLTHRKLEGVAGAGGVPENAATGILELPTGYRAPAPPPGVLESRDLADCEAELVRRYLLVKRDFEAETGRCLAVTCTWRSQERQQQLYAQGRTLPGQIVTKIDGVTKKSRHMTYPSQALDVAVDLDPGPGKHLSWNPRAFEPLGPICARHGLTWGGSFSGFGEHGDYPHIELPAGVV